MSASFDLRRTQDLFWGLVTSPEGVRPGLADMVRRGAARPDDLDAMIVGDERLPAADRLDIYANMYFFRLLDCLKEDYPRLLEAIGPERFHNLVTDYLLLHPSSHPSLRHLGRHLPGFLSGHPLGRECPCLVDLARLDWARADLFDAADARPVTRDDLARLPQEEAGGARFSLIPAFALLRLAHDAPRLWTAMKERAAVREGSTAERGASGNHPGTCAVHAGTPAVALPRMSPRSTAARVWRRGFVVYHRGIDEDEAEGLDLLSAGEPLARIAQRASAGRSAARATERFGRMLESWIDDGILHDLVLPRLG